MKQLVLIPYIKLFNYMCMLYASEHDMLFADTQLKSGVICIAKDSLQWKFELDRCSP